MTTVSDVDKNVTVGTPDGPFRFVESLGEEVPTFIDERSDLVHPKAHGIKCVDYHVPFAKRGMYRPDQLPTEYYEKRRGRIQVNLEGFVLCGGTNASGFPCANPAVNRSVFCRNHGGALHPCDKKISPATNQMGLMAAAESQAAIDKLDRVQRFMQGFLKVEELDDDEITGAFVRNSDGVPVANARLGVRFQQEMVKELARRMNHFLQMKLPNMLKVVTEIAESEIVEPQDRIKAAIWAAERVIGKTPDVIIHGKTEKAYESVFETLESGSREDYRKGNYVSSQRAIEAVSEDESILDVEEIGLGDSGFDDSEEFINGYSESNGHSESTMRNFIGSGQNVDSSRSGESGSGANDSSESEIGTNDISTDDIKSEYNETKPDKVKRYVTLEEKRAAIRENRERLKKAKSRRFAARASGVSTTASIPWVLDWTRLRDNTYKVRIIKPEQLTPALLEKIEAKKLAEKEKESENV